VDTVTTEPSTRPSYGSTEQIAQVLRLNNPDPSLVESRTLAIIKLLTEGAESIDERFRYVRNAITASELVRGEIQAADR